MTYSSIGPWSKTVTYMVQFISCLFALYIMVWLHLLNDIFFIYYFLVCVQGIFFFIKVKRLPLQWDPKKVTRKNIGKKCPTIQEKVPNDPKKRGLTIISLDFWDCISDPKNTCLTISCTEEYRSARRCQPSFLGGPSRCHITNIDCVQFQ